MPMPLLRMSFPDRAALAQEHEANLKHGRAFIKDADGIAALTDCRLQLVIEDCGAVLAIDAQAVMVCDSGPMRGIGVQLRPFNGEVVAKLDAFVSGVAIEAKPEAANGAGAGDGNGTAAGVGTGSGTESASTSESESESESEAVPEPVPDSEAEAEADSEPDTGSEPDADDESELEADAEPGSELDLDPETDLDALPADQQRTPKRLEQLRKLSLAQQQKVARTGNLNDRVMLERLFGKQVWEALLHNTKITVPEVARMARKGSIPRPLLELIVENNTWVQAPIVRRAILGNPRVSSEAIMKLLRMTPKHELKAIHKTTTYSAQVREAARKVLEL